MTDKKTTKNTQNSKTEIDAVEHLFGSKTRVRLLRLILDNPTESFFVREITRKIDVQLNSVRRELQNLIDIGVVQEIENSIDLSQVSKEKRGSAKKKKYYGANPNFPLFEELRSIMKKSALLMNGMFLQALQECGDLQFVMLTGTFIEANVPTDVLIVGSVDNDHLKEAVKAFEHEIGREINYTCMDLDEYRYRQDIRDRFLLTLLEVDNIVLLDTIPSKKSKKQSSISK